MDKEKYIVLKIEDAERAGSVLATLPWAQANEAIVGLSNNKRLDVFLDEMSKKTATPEEPVK